MERKSKKAAKRNRRQHKPRRESLPSYLLVSGRDEAEELIKENNLNDAVVSEELERRYPRNPQVLGVLLEVYLRQQDMWSFQAVCQRLVEIDPNTWRYQT